MKYFFILCLMTILTNLNAQNRIINGLVVDKKGQPLPYAKVIDGCNNGSRVSADVNGKFSIKIDVKCTRIILECIGFDNKSFKIDSNYNAANILTIPLNAKAFEEENVVVVGYGTSLSKRSTQNLPKVKAKSVSALKETKKNGLNNPFLSTRENSSSTFAIDVDKASYVYVKNALLKNIPVNANLVRIEEMINYFDYNYPTDNINNPYTIISNVTKCPWNDANLVMKVAIQAQKQNKEKTLPGHYTFLVDVSGSMNGYLQLVQKNIIRLLDSITPTDKISLVTYAGYNSTLLEAVPAMYKDSIIKTVNKLKADGGTNGSGGIEQAYEIAQQHFVEDGNNRVILCTDGDFNIGLTSSLSLEKFISNYRDDNIFLTCIGYGQHNTYRDAIMETLADKGNGAYYLVFTEIDIDRIVQKDFKQITSVVAKDVKLQIHFNPKFVDSFTLIGYNNKRLNEKDFDNDKKDGGELGTNGTVTAFYEIVPNKNYKNALPTGAYFSTESNEIAIIKTRYKKPHGISSKRQDLVVPYITNKIEGTETHFSLLITAFGNYLLTKDLQYKTAINNLLVGIDNKLDKDKTEAIALIKKHISE